MVVNCDFIREKNLFLGGNNLDLSEPEQYVIAHF